MNPITRDTKREVATKQQQLQLSTPTCPRCGNHGFTNCPTAIAPHGDLIALAYRRGTACTCASGREFARQQMEWVDPEMQEAFHMGNPGIGHRLGVGTEEFNARSMLRIECECGWKGQWYRAGFGPFSESAIGAAILLNRKTENIQ